jgi:transcriptional regulator with XRE-family HTH domain
LATALHTEAHQRLVALIAARRRAGKLTQQQVADRLGKPQSYVAKVEGGERRLDVIEFVAMAKALGCEPKELLDALEAGARDGSNA